MENIKQLTRFATSYYAFPLFLFFLIADWIYYNEYFFEFFAYRVLAVFVIAAIGLYAKRISSFHHTERLVTMFAIACSAPLSLMVWRINDIGSPYYAGLNLVLIGLSYGFRVSWSTYFFNILAIVGPFFFIFPFLLQPKGESSFILHSMFMVSTILIAAVSRLFNELLYLKEFQGRIKLEEEINHRGELINKKTKEAVDLAGLSKQFSPQVVHAIREGSIDITKPVHRADICVIFIDIVGSTERFLRLDRDDVNKILSMYMEDTMSTLLKYDITIDKFLGDGVLAFSNDPIKHDDFVERMLLAALEIQGKFKRKRIEYMDVWLSDFEIRMGISAGYASVGFYGSDLYFKSYTAIGRVVNLATRLCSAAEPNQILIGHEIIAKLKKRNSLYFGLKEVEERKLKGFEDGSVKIYELLDDGGTVVDSADNETELCPNGHGVLFLDTDEKGIFVYTCRTCGYKPEDIRQASEKEAA